MNDKSKKEIDNVLLTYKVLHLAQIDLSQSAFFADHLCAQRFHYEPWEINWKDYLHQMAYMTSLIVAYSRPFIPGRGFPNFPSNLLKDLTLIEKQLHEKLIDQRNRTHAHTDLDLKKVRLIIQNGTPNAIEAHPHLRMSADEIKEIRKLIYKISIAIQKKMSEIAQSYPQIFTIY